MTRNSHEKTEIERLRAENRHLQRLLAEKAEQSLATTERQTTAQTRELAHTREELEQQARLFDTLLSSIVDFAYVFDREGRFTYINQALLDLWQMTLEEARGKTFFELPYPQALAAQLHTQIKTVFRTGQRLRDETPYTGAAGTTGYYEYIFVPVFGKDSQVEVVAGSTRDITSRQQDKAEKETLLKTLEVERERLTSLFVQVPAFIAVTRGPEHIFEMANPPYFQLVGQRDILGKSVREAFPEIEGRGFFEHLDAVYRTGQPFIGKDRLIRFQEQGGAPLREHSLDFIYQPLIEADGSISGIFVHGVDLTERKRAEEALRESEERVRLATDAAVLGVWVWAPATDQVAWENDRMYQIYGLSPEDEPLPSAQFLAEIVHPDDADAFARAIAVPVETGEPFYFAGQFRRKDGALRWIEFLGRLQPRVNGAPLRIVGTAADITDRKRAEEQERQATEDARTAAEANAKFRTFFEQGSYFAGLMTLDGTVVEANRISLDACGFTREEVVGKKFWDCGWWNRSEELMTMVREGTQAAAAGRFFRQETRYFVADGRERRVDLILAPVKDEAGRVLFIAPTGVDITERTQAEQALAERAQEIAALNVRLRRAMTETHHRVKNNLQLIASLVEMQLLEGTDSVPVNELKRLRVHISTLATVHDILTREAQKDGEGATLSAKAVLDKLLPLMQTTTGERRIHFRLDDLILSVRQCTSLAMITNELVANALKHTRTDVELRLVVRGGTVLLVISDNGPGFPPDFDPVRAAHTGLDLVLNLTRHDLGGTIHFESKAQGGGYVSLTFPLSRKKERPSAS